MWQEEYNIRVITFMSVFITQVLWWLKEAG